MAAGEPEIIRSSRRGLIPSPVIWFPDTGMMWMKVTGSRILNSCLDGTVQVELVLDRAMDRPFIDHLASCGQLEYFPDFARPFFRITKPGTFIIKGIEGESTCELHILDNTSDPDQLIRSHIGGFGTPGPGRMPG